MGTPRPPIRVGTFMEHQSRRTARRIAATAAIVAVFATACTAGSDEGPLYDLVVLDASGDVVLVSSDGTSSATLADVPSGSSAFQPIWSPDGSAVLYSEEGPSESALVVAPVDGDAPPTRFSTETRSFFYAWEPGGDRFASLRPSPGGGLALDVASIGSTAETLDLGSPFYFSWAPDGGQMVAHIGSERLDVLEVGGTPRSVDRTPGSFQAPSWTEDGIVYVDRTGQLLLENEDGVTRPIAEVAGSAQFSVAASRVAVQSFAGDTTGSNGIAAAFQTIPVIPPGRLAVVDIESGVWTSVTGDNVVGFFWDPAGEQLLYLEIADETTPTLRFGVWEDGESVTFDEFVVEPSWLAEFLPFFDQYAVSTSLWAPDGRAFAFAGTVEGRSGIWVQPIDQQTPVAVSDGTWVAWVPEGS